VSRRRTEFRLAALAVIAVGLVLSAVLGIFVYMSVTARPIHPNPLGVPSTAQSGPSPKWAHAVEQARQVAREGLVEQNVPGLSVAVGADGGIVWAEGFGWADLEQRVPVAPDTRFRIGTSSKMLTSAAVGLLLERGQLTLEDAIQAHLPAYPAKPWPVTLRHLMGHTSGIPPDEGDEEPIHVRCEHPADALDRFADTPLLFEPGTKYRDSSYGWILVSAAVEATSGRPFNAFMRSEVFGPLGMDDTRAEAAPGTAPNQATYYFPRFAADPRYGPQDPDNEDFSCFSGASAFSSTPSDLVRFGLAIEGGKLLRPATVQLLRTSQRLASGEETGYGLGWDLETVTLAGRQAAAIGHDGVLRGGTVMSFMTFPEQGLIVAVTSNTSFADTPSIALKIAQVFAEDGEAPGRE
jgi:CubicO group peptidase (beta-lactamase class C family)